MADVWISYEGRSVGNWRLDSFLGEREGEGFYVARSDRSPQPALMKLIATAGDAAPAIRASWKRAKELSHDNLLGVREIGDAELDGTRVTYGVFDLPDDDLGEMLGVKKLGPEQGRPLFSAIAQGLDYLHRRDLRHGAVHPSNVFLVEGGVRLGVDAVSPAGATGKESDMRQFGTTLVQALTGGTDGVARLESPFKEIAAGCLNGSGDQKWTAARVLQVLSGNPASVVDTIPELPALPATSRRATRPEAAPRSTGKWPLAAAALLPALLLGYWLLGKPTRPPAAEPRPNAESSPAVVPPAPPVVEKKPDPTHRTPAPLPRPAETAPRKAASQSGSWAVIAATYVNYGPAANRAEKMKKQSPQLHPHVFPEDGKGKAYYVVLGSGLSQDAASQLLSMARQHGAPRDAYVTKLERP